MSIFGQPHTFPERRRGLRLLANLYSLGLHSGLIGILFFLPPGILTSPEPQSVYQSIVVPLEKEHKVIWYRFEKQLPAISPPTPATAPGRTEQPANQRIVTDPKANPGKQFVWIPAPRLKLENDITAPNLVALKPPSLVLPPEKPQPKAFQAPETAKPTVRTPELPNAPAIALKDEQSSELADAVLNRPVAAPRRSFTPPPGTGKKAAAAPTDALPSAPSLEAAGGTANVSVAIIGVNPANVPQPPAPNGGRAARISAGPDSSGTGPAQLTGGNSSLVVPGVSVTGAPKDVAVVIRPPSPANRAAGSTPGIGQPQMPDQAAAFQSTPHVSVPQWPHARNLPPAIERQFADRVVYTTLIPAARSGGDWVVWFAEQAVTPPDVRLLMRPPTLLHSAPLPPVPGQTDHGTGTLVVTGIIGTDGHFGAPAEPTDPSARELLEALHEWRFNPAMRNGVAIDVEAIIEIPLVFSAAR